MNSTLYKQGRLWMWVSLQKRKISCNELHELGWVVSVTFICIDTEAVILPWSWTMVTQFLVWKIQCDKKCINSTCNETHACMKEKKVVGPLYQKRYGRIHDIIVCREHWKYQWFCKNHCKFQLFLRKPSPLNVFWSLAIDINGFWVVPPLLSMVFNGQEQLVERWQCS